MNILQVSGGKVKIPVRKGGSVESYIFNASKQFSRMGHNVTILDRKYSESDPHQEYVEHVRIVRLNAKKFEIPLSTASPLLATLYLTIRDVLDQMFFAIEAKKYIKTNANNFDLIVLHFSITSFILVTIGGKSLKSKLIYTSHTARRSKDHRSFLDKVAILLENRVANPVKKVIISSESAREELIKVTKKRPKDLIVTPTAYVDTDFFNPKLDTHDIKRKYGLCGRITVLFVGRITANKGIEYLLKAMYLIKKNHRYDNIRLLLVGPLEESRLRMTYSPYFKRLVELVKKYDLQRNVKLVGLVSNDELRKLYVASDIFVLSSVAEASPLSISEAMASAKPVIATRIGGVPLQVKDEWNGFLVEPRDENQLAEKICYLIEEPQERARMGMNGRKMAEEKFAWKKVARFLLASYRTP